MSQATGVLDGWFAANMDCPTNHSNLVWRRRAIDTSAGQHHGVFSVFIVKSLSLHSTPFSLGLRLVFQMHSFPVQSALLTTAAAPDLSCNLDIDCAMYKIALCD